MQWCIEQLYSFRQCPKWLHASYFYIKPDQIILYVPYCVKQVVKVNAQVTENDSEFEQTIFQLDTITKDHPWLNEMQQVVAAWRAQRCLLSTYPAPNAHSDRLKLSDNSQQQQ